MTQRKSVPSRRFRLGLNPPFGDDKQPVKQTNMFTTAIIGKKILIKHARGAGKVKVKHNYKVVSMPNEQSVVLLIGGAYYTWTPAFMHDWEVVGIAKKAPIEIGKSYIVGKPTASHKIGDIKIVTGFVCDDPLRVILEGTRPGGWITPDSLIEVLDLSKFRFKTAREICAEEGDVRIRNFIPFNGFMNLLGKSLKDLSNVSQAGDSIRIGDKYATQKYITDKPVDQSFVLKFLNEKQCNDMGFTLPTKDLYDKPLKIAFEVEDTEEDFLKLFDTDYCQGHDAFKIKGLTLQTHSVTLNEENVKTDTPILPF